MTVMGQRRSPASSPQKCRSNAGGSLSPCSVAAAADNICTSNNNNNSINVTPKNRCHDKNSGGDESKVRNRSCRESLLLFVLLKPQFLTRVILFAVVALCSLSVAFRLNKVAVQQAFLDDPYFFHESSSGGSASASSSTHRVLFQQPPAVVLRMPFSTRSTTTTTANSNHNNNNNQVASDSIMPILLDAGYTSKPRVVGCYWPADYDDDVEGDETGDEETGIAKNNTKRAVSGSNKPSTTTTTSTTRISLTIERLDANLIRPLTDRSVHLSKEQVKAQLHLQNSKDYNDGMADPFEEGDCNAQYEWQKTSYPTCNNLHEQALWEMVTPNQASRVKFLTYGYWRDVWMVRDFDWEPLALKTIRYEHDYEERNYDRHRRDAIAMEHLTASPNVLGIYSFCGNSGIFEYANGGSLEDAIWYSDEPEWNSTEKLVVAYQVASGLADLHNADKEGRPSIAHTDITPSQFVFVNRHGRFLLNDFNRCRFIRWNEKEDKACPFEVGNNPGTFRAPEELAYEPETEKIDVYSMGNIFYALMMKLYPFEDISKRKAQKHIMKGERPPLNETFTNSKDEYTQALVMAMNMSWIHDPTKRASAREVERYLDNELTRLGVHGKPL